MKKIIFMIGLTLYCSQLWTAQTIINEQNAMLQKLQQAPLSQSNSYQQQAYANAIAQQQYEAQQQYYEQLQRQRRHKNHPKNPSSQSSSSSSDNNIVSYASGQVGNVINGQRGIISNDYGTLKNSAGDIATIAGGVGHLVEDTVGGAIKNVYATGKQAADTIGDGVVAIGSHGLSDIDSAASNVGSFINNSLGF